MVCIFPVYSLGVPIWVKNGKILKIGVPIQEKTDPYTNAFFAVLRGYEPAGAELGTQFGTVGEL